MPSPTGIGIGILVPFSVVFTMFLGGLVGYVWEKQGQEERRRVHGPARRPGLIAGEAIVAVSASIYLYYEGQQLRGAWKIRVTTWSPSVDRLRPHGVELRRFVVDDERLVLADPLRAVALRRQRRERQRR